MNKKSYLDKILDCFFDKTKLSVLGFFVLGIILRLIAARNLGVTADNVNQAIAPFGIFNSGKLVIWAQSTALWYYIEGVFYNLFGLTTLVSRFATLLFGSLLIILMYIFVKKIFKSEKIALIASFITAVSPALIKQTLPEMDVTVTFFLVLSALFLFKYFDTRSKKHLFLSALVMGVGVMIKLYVLFFAISFIIILIYKDYKNRIQKKITIKKVLIFGIIISILVLPTLAHNYLLYKDKGFMDFIFTTTLKVGLEESEQYYGWDAAWGKDVDYGGFFFGNQIDFEGESISFLPGFVVLSYYLFLSDPVIMLLGIIGLILVFKREKNYVLFFVITSIIAFVYLGANIPLIKHFTWLHVLLIPFASNLIYETTKKIKVITTKHVLIVILIFNLIYLGSGSFANPFYGESAFSKLVKFGKNEVSQTNLVVADSRIYRGNIQWAFIGKNYVESSQFFSIADQLNQQGNLQNVEVYYIECVVDDCGWGTIKNQPEFNQSMEEITEFFSNVSHFTKDFEGPVIGKYYLPLVGEKAVRYRVYKANLLLNPQILEVVKQTHTRFLLPENYDRSIHPIFDDYQVNGFIDNLINKLAWLVFYFELVFSFFVIVIVLYLFIEEENSENDKIVKIPKPF